MDANKKSERRRIKKEEELYLFSSFSSLNDECRLVI